MNELEIRALLQAKLAESHHGQGAAFVSELFIDSFARRADLVMANGKLSAFEIKSERDTLERLDGQLETYLRLFEQVTVVCAERHQAGVQERIPDGVGVWVLSENGSFKVLKRAKTHRQTSHQSWLSFLPVDELRNLLGRHGLQRTGTRDVLVVRASAIAIKHVRQYVLEFFKHRREERIVKINAAKTARARPQRILPTPALNLRLMGSTPLRAIPRLIA